MNDRLVAAIVVGLAGLVGADATLGSGDLTLGAARAAFHLVETVAFWR